jgi:hypothetical protein
MQLRVRLRENDKGKLKVMHQESFNLLILLIMVQTKAEHQV